jgi:hypothetical protein
MAWLASDCSYLTRHAECPTPSRVPDADSLEAFVARAIGRPVHPGVQAMADHLWSLRPGAAALIAYGSCLRDEDPRDTLIDFYLLMPDGAGTGGNAMARLACRLLPPNVYYLAHAPYRAKYATMTVTQFIRRMRADSANPYFWARFAQPVALLHGDGPVVARALATALRTLYAHGRGLGGEGADAFAKAFTRTYATEFRSERENRAGAIVASNRAFYEEAARRMADVAPIRANWRGRALLGKALSALRLAKAAFTFAGGADYIAWKIERHSGQAIELTAWQRRHPVIAGALLLPRLLRSGAVR